MICPRCGAEYRKHVARCADCDTELVAVRPEEQPTPDAVEVLSTTDLTLVPVVRSLLDGADIPYEIQGEQGFLLEPAVHIFSGHRRSNIVFRVPAEREEEARALLEPMD